VPTTSIKVKSSSLIPKKISTKVTFKTSNKSTSTKYKSTFTKKVINNTKDKKKSNINSILRYI